MPAPKTTEIAVSSGRFDRSTKALTISVNKIEKATSASLHTEVTGRSPAELIKAFKDPNSRFIHIFGPGASEECLLRYNQRLWTPAGDAFARQITDLTWVRSKEYGGKKAECVRALTAPMAWKADGKVTVYVTVHMPLDNTKPRAAAWFDCCVGLVALVKEMRKFYPGCDFVIGGDWNKDWRKGSEHDLMVKHMLVPLKKVDKRFEYCWDEARQLPAGGTHPQPGPDALIDGFFSTLDMLAVGLMADDASSDHRPMKVKVRV